MKKTNFTITGEYAGDDAPGHIVTIRGKQASGKSTLLEGFLKRRGLSSVHYFNDVRLVGDFLCGPRAPKIDAVVIEGEVPADERKDFERVASYFPHIVFVIVSTEDTTEFDFYGSVKAFNEAAGVTTDHYNARQVGFYTGMQCEELAEKLEAIFGNDRGVRPPSINMLVESLERIGDRLKNNIYPDMCANANRHDLLDADVDLLVVSIGSMLSQGANGRGAIEEVCGANMAKVVDGKLARHPETGKILKPEGWTPPDLHKYLAE